MKPFEKVKPWLLGMNMGMSIAGMVIGITRGSILLTLVFIAVFTLMVGMIE